MKKNYDIILDPYIVIPFESRSLGDQVIDWGNTYSKASEIYNKTKGKGSVIFVLDTGAELTHSDLKDNALNQFGENFTDSTTKADLNGHGCVHPETLVQTSFCGITKIKDLYDKLEVPEYLTDQGLVKDIKHLNINTYGLNKKTGISEISQVEFVHKTPVKEEIINVNLEGDITLKLTPWHPVYLKDQNNKVINKRADELVNGDKLIRGNGENSGNLITDYYRIHYYESKKCSNCNYELITMKECKGRCQCKKCGKNKWEKSLKEKRITEDLSYLIGLIITDGHVNSLEKRNDYVVSISNKDLNLLEAAKTLFEKNNIKNVKIKHNEERNIYTLMFQNKDFVKFLIACGVKDGCKTYTQGIPEFIGKSPKSVIEAFIAGLIDGDGCIDKETGRNRIITASRTMADELNQLFSSIGIKSLIFTINPKDSFIKEKLVRSTTPIYHVRFLQITEGVINYMNQAARKQNALNKISLKKHTAKVKSISKDTFNDYFYDFTVKDTNTYLANGHFVSNTLCSGIIAAVDNSFGVIGIAPESKVIPYKVLNDQGSGNYTWIANAIKRAADVDLGKEYNSYYRIISLSLGGNGTSKAIIDAVKYAISKGCIIVAAAGNSYYKGIDNVNFPANIEEVIAVASIDKYEKPSDFSSGGKLIDIAAPGSGIYSTYLNNTYGLFNGTSFSCPYISGAIALLLTGGLGLKNQQEVSDYLKKYAKDIFDKGFDVRTGYGSVILPNYFNKEEVPDKPIEDNNAIKLLYHKSLNLAYNTDRIKGTTIQLEVELEINSTEDFDNIYLSAVKYFDNILNSFNNTLILSKADKLVSKLNGEKFIILQRDKANLRTITEEIYKLMNVLPYKVTNFKVTSKDQCFSL